jgi:hypothetical protein
MKYPLTHYAPMLPMRVSWSMLEPIRPIAGLPQFTRAYVSFRIKNRPWPFEALFSGYASMINTLHCDA